MSELTGAQISLLVRVAHEPNIHPDDLSDPDMAAAGSLHNHGLLRSVPILDELCGTGRRACLSGAIGARRSLCRCNPRPSPSRRRDPLGDAKGGRR